MQIYSTLVSSNHLHLPCEVLLTVTRGQQPRYAGVIECVDIAFKLSACQPVRCAVIQDAHLRPNFTAVVDILKELENSGLVAKLDVQYWQKGSAFI